MNMRFELLPEPLDIEPNLVGVAFEVGLLERLLAPEKEVVHGPEPALRGRGFARLRRGERVRMDLDEWEVAEDEAEWNTLGLEGLDASIGGAAEDEERRPARAAHVVARLRDLGDEGCAHSSSTAGQIAARSTSPNRSRWSQ
jgi:hypothetical protein